MGFSNGRTYMKSATLFEDASCNILVKHTSFHSLLAQKVFPCLKLRIQNEEYLRLRSIPVTLL
jgi:hypothetical protein